MEEFQFWVTGEARGFGSAEIPERALKQTNKHVSHSSHLNKQQLEKKTKKTKQNKTSKQKSKQKN